MDKLNIRAEHYRLGDSTQALQGLAILVETYNRKESQINITGKSDSDLLRENQKILECVSQSLTGIAENLDATRQAIFDKASAINDKICKKSENTK